MRWNRWDATVGGRRLIRGSARGWMEGLEDRLLLTGNPPVAAADLYSTLPGAILNISSPGVLANDTDLESDALSAIVVGNPSNGSLTLNPNGSFVYTPNNGFHGQDSFTYKANDGTSDSNTVTVSIAVNTTPTAVNDSYTTNQGTNLSIGVPAGVLGNDTDADLDSLTADLITTTSQGTLTLNPNGSFTYVPNSGFSGTDSFTYKANDGLAQSSVATVTISVVNQAPSTQADSFEITQNTARTVATPGVLANDTDPENDPLQATLISTTTNGTLSLNPNGSFTYTPNTGFTGTDSFTYRAIDANNVGNVATVTLNVTAPPNVAPATNADTYTTNVGTTLTVPVATGVLANDFDSNSDSLTATLVSTTANGTLTLNADGSFTYVPNAAFRGTDTFVYKANDGNLSSPSTTVTITVNNTPTAVNDAYTTVTTTPLNISVPGVLSNDTDANSDTLTAVLLSTTANGTLTLNANGSFTYTANSGFTGTDSFTYRAFDGLIQSSPATVTITVNPVNNNQAPVAVNDTYNTTKGTAITTTAATGVLANDTDANGNTLTATLVTPPTFGTVTLNPDGSFTYTPNANFSGTDAFTYMANDGQANSTVATAILFVNAPGTGTSTLTGAGVSGNDTGVSGDGITTNTTPAFTGIAAPGFIVKLYVQKLGQTVVTQVGQATAGSDGSYNVRSSALANGTYAFTATSTDPSSTTGEPSASVALGNLTIQAVPTKVVSVQVNPAQGRIVLTFSSNLSASNLATVLASSNFSVTRSGRSIPVTNASLSAPNQIILTLKSGSRIGAGTILLNLKSANITDAGGQALDGEFTKTLPSGDGTLGGDFRARLVVSRSSAVIKPVTLKRR